MWGIRANATDSTCFLTVHPHVCGEYALFSGVSCADFGSPPRVWGILVHTLPTKHIFRFTPTCVGNTGASYSPNVIQTVHPHVCGEYKKNGMICREIYGSPPRVWGIPGKNLEILFSTRFTPTCVGNTSEDLKNCKEFSVHPHVCGEYIPT